MEFSKQPIQPYEDHEHVLQNRIAEEYRIILQTAMDGFLRLSKDGRLMEVNDSYCRMSGYSEVELLGMQISDLEASEQETETISRLQRIRAEGEDRFESVHKRKDGSRLSVEIGIQYSSNEGGEFIAFVRDITEAKKLRERLELSEKRHREAASLMADYIFEVEIDEKRRPNLVWTSSNLSKITGRGVEEAATVEQWKDIFHPEDYPKAMRLLAEVLERHEGGEIDCRTFLKSGEMRWVHVKVQPVVDEATGQTVRILGSVIDISERKRAEEALRESEKRFRRMFDDSPVGVVSVSPDFRFLRCNESFCDFLGYRESELLGRTFLDVTHPDDLNAGKREIQAILAGELEKVAFSKRYLHKDGRTLWGRLNIRLIRDERDQPLHFLTVVEDITHRKQAEDERAKLERLEAIGLLAGGIAHDFNNMLTGITVNISLAQMSQSSGEDISECLTDAERAATRARDLTRQLLTFARGGAPVKDVASVEELIRESARFVQHGSKVTLDFEIAPDLNCAHIDQGQIAEVMNNLVINAIQAMPKGGRVILSADNATVGPDNDLNLKAGNYLKIAVADTGQGIDPKSMGRIFEPYFTTKEKGVGLGLATSYSIAARHGGTLSVDSQLGKGTTFTLYLPSAKDMQPLKPEKSEIVDGGKGRILMMDDDESVLQAGSKILRQMGYAVETARDGTEAVDKYRRQLESGDPFSVVILDLTVPDGMGGLQAMKELLLLDPEVKAIVSSGYSEDAVMAEHRQYGFSCKLAKPYTFAELSQVLARTLESGS